MKVVVIYESIYGNTHLVADAIAKGLNEVNDVTVVAVDGATPELVGQADLVIVGGPTHAHGMSRPSTRKAAVDAAQKPGHELDVDPDAAGPGLREWFTSIGDVATHAAAFDTRLDAPAVLTGRASKGIARLLRRHGFTVVADPESFFVTKDSHLADDEETRARSWGARLAASMTSAARR
jgi:flavodoxin-like protein